MAGGWRLWSPTHRAMKLRDGWGTLHLGWMGADPFHMLWVGNTGGGLNGSRPRLTHSR